MGFDSESCGSTIFSLVVSEFGSFGGEISYSAGVFWESILKMIFILNFALGE